MRSIVSDHFRDNVVGYLALFLVLTGGTAYALDGSNTVFTDDIVDGEVRNGDLRQGAVTTGKIANGDVLTEDLGLNSVRGDRVADESLTGADLADRSIGGQKVGVETLAGVNVNDGSLFGADIADGAIGAADIATGAVGSSELATGAVGTSDLSTGAFNSTDLAPKSAQDPRFEIVPNAVQGEEVSDNSLTGSDINESTLDTPEAAYYTVTPGIAVPWTTPDPSSPDLRTVAARRVEPGRYVVMAKAQVVGDGPSSVHCFLLVNGSEVDSAGAQLDGDGFAGGSLAMLGFAGTATSSIDLAVRCSRIGPDEVRVSYRRLVAVKVNRLIGADAS